MIFLYSPRIYQAEMAVLRAMEDISKDPSEKSSILLAIIKTARVLQEQKVAWYVTRHAVYVHFCEFLFFSG